MLGVGERTFRRWCRRFEEEGEAGLLDRRIGKVSGRRVPVERCEEVDRLYRTRYRASPRGIFTNIWCATTFAWSFSWTKAFLQSRNLLGKRRVAGRTGASGRVVRCLE